MIEHANFAKTFPTRTKLSKEITACGFDSFDKVILVNDLLAKDCAFYERFWIGIFSDTGQSLNEMIGSQGWASDEVAIKISKAKTGKPGVKTGPISEERRKKLSDAHKGYKMPTEQRQKISAALKGREKTEEHLKRLSDSQKGKFVSFETKEKQRQAKLGRKLSDEHRAKLSIARRARPHKINEEARQRLIERNKNMVVTPEMKEKRRLNALGRKLTDEAKEKCRQASLRYWEERKALGAKA
jgi:hypothetical protein